MRCSIRVSLETMKTWCQHHVSVIVKEEVVPRNPQIEIHHTKIGNLCSFGISKYRKDERKRHSNSVGDCWFRSYGHNDRVIFRLEPNK